jgi:hypothetical protein
MTYTIPTSTGLTPAQKAWLNLLTFFATIIAAATIPQALTGQLPAWVPGIPAAAGTLAQLIQLYMSGRLDPALVGLLPELQLLLAQIKVQQPGQVIPSTSPPPAIVITPPAPSAPPSTVLLLSPGFVNPAAAAPDI